MYNECKIKFIFEIKEKEDALSNTKEKKKAKITDGIEIQRVHPTIVLDSKTFNPLQTVRNFILFQLVANPHFIAFNVIENKSFEANHEELKFLKK